MKHLRKIDLKVISKYTHINKSPVVVCWTRGKPDVIPGR